MGAVQVSYQDPQLKGALMISAALHLMLMIAIALGLPAAKKPLPEELLSAPPPVAIFVDFEASPQTRSAKPPPPKKAKPKKPRKAASMSAEAPPDLSKDSVPLPPEDTPPPEEQAEAIPLPPKTAKPLPAKPKPPKRKELTKRALAENTQQFSSLLKNLIVEEEDNEPLDEVEAIDEEQALANILETITQQQEEELDTSEPDPTAQPEDAFAALLQSDVLAAQPAAPVQPKVRSIDAQLNFSEIDAVKQQLAGCWNVLSGARYAENLTVDVKLFMNPDRTLRKAVIVDQGRYNSDAVFRAAADSALRALRMERCSPLNLPPHKYEQWKTTVITFDPREML